jgi:hypothetical protein
MAAPFVVRRIIQALSRFRMALLLAGAIKLLEDALLGALNQLPLLSSKAARNAQG